MPPQEPQNPQIPSFQQSTPVDSPPVVPSSWNTLFIISLVLDVLMPLIGVIMGEILYHKAKVAGNDAWRKKARWSIYFGCLVIVLALVFNFSMAYINARHDTLSDNTSNSQASSTALPSKAKATLYVATIDAALGTYYANENPSNQKNYKLTYPTLAQLNDPSWRQSNGVDLSKGDIPSSDLATITFITGQPTKPNEYGYTALPAGCQNTQASPCTNYAISAASSSGIYTENY